MNKDLTLDLHKANLSTFVNAYFFVWKIKLHNAEVIFHYLNSNLKLPQIVQELMVGFFTQVPYEVLLMLYDAVKMLKTVDESYKYPEDGAIASAMQIRHHIIAHRGKNWLSPESQEVREALEKNPNKMFKECHAAALELVAEIKKRDLFANPWNPFPNVVEFKTQDLVEMFDKIPQGTFWAKVHSATEMEEFFKK